MNDTPAEMKRCTACQEIKPLSEFGRETTRKGHPAVKAQCRQCVSEYKQRVWRSQRGPAVPVTWQIPPPASYRDAMEAPEQCPCSGASCRCGAS